MEYVMSWTDALAFNHDLPFIPLHYTYVHFTYWPQFTSLHFTSLHFRMISPTPSLHLIYYFPNPFPKITWFTGESLKHLQAVGSRAGWAYLQRNTFRYLLLLPAPSSSRYTGIVPQFGCDSFHTNPLTVHESTFFFHYTEKKLGVVPDTLR
jgi:hypothetical protein